jgi:bifunctional ADP-heptose synthase (sugar kinase/adenylyltransferase)
MKKKRMMSKKSQLLNIDNKNNNNNNNNNPPIYSTKIHNIPFYDIIIYIPFHVRISKIKKNIEIPSI